MNAQPFDSVSFIGGGRVTRFLLEGWKHADALPGWILVCDPDETVLDSLQSDFTEVQPTDLLEAAKTPLIILAVHPPDAKTVLEKMKGSVPASSVVLSLAPKITVAAIQLVLGIRRVARMIPNAPSGIGRGFNPVAYAPELEEEMVVKLDQLFTPWGEFPKVAEGDLEVYAIVSAMGPTYMWFQWQVMRDLAAGFGLTREKADRALLATITGSAELLLASGRDSEAVLDMIPVKPLQHEEEVFRTAYSKRLPALYEKLKVK